MKKLFSNSLINALAVVAYIFLVALFFSYANKIFGKADSKTFLEPMAFLLLFVCSAAITGSLVLGKPVMLYLDNKKTEAIKFFLKTIGWLFLILLIIFIVLGLVRGGAI